MTKSADFQDFEDIFERVIVSIKRTPDEWRDHINKHRLDTFHTIPDPRNGGTLMVGAEVTERFHAIARRHLNSQPGKKARTDLPSFVTHLTAKFSEFFLQPEQSRPRDEANVARWIASAYKATAKEHEEGTHYIPCALIFSQTVKEFVVGPVTFYHTSEFFRLFGEEIEGLRLGIAARHRQNVEGWIAQGYSAENAATPEQSIQYGNYLTDGLLKFYKRFNWFAVVQVPASDAEVSYDRALIATRGALNIIKLLLGAGYTDRLRTADDPGEKGAAATLFRDSSGELNVSLSYSPVDNTAGDNWLEYISGPYFDQATRSLTLCSAFEVAPPLCARFIDALHWFGEAVTERSRAARIVKFVTAIERICGTGIDKDPVTGEERGVTDIVTTRAAILHSVLEQIPFDESHEKINRIYGWRSDLVHGSVSPFDEKVAAQVRETYEVTRTVLLAALNYYGQIGFEKPTLNEKGLKSEFQHLEQWNAAGRPKEI
jgi:hypothetical protein